jgi:hypothetical protein
MSEHDAIIELLQRHGRGISQRVLEEQYRDPFWTERYGSRGRRHADEDSDFHLRYLARALQHGDPGVMVRYARWLRDVLASRGMCTRHLAENFRLLAEGLEAMHWSGGETAVAFVRSGQDALLYDEPVARAVQEAAGKAAAEVSRAHRERFPRGWKHAAERPDGLRDDLLNYLSYLVDALALGSPATLVAHTAWFAGFLQRHGTPREQLDSALALLRDSLDRLGLPSEVRTHLEAALAAPTSAPPPEPHWKTSSPLETQSTR